MDNFVLDLPYLLYRSHCHIPHLQLNYLPNHNECLVCQDCLFDISVPFCVCLITVGSNPISAPKFDPL